MCGCQAHHELVDCECKCDHTADRMNQWRTKSRRLEVEVADLTFELKNEIKSNQVNTLMLALIMSVYFTALLFLTDDVRTLTVALTAAPIATVWAAVIYLGHLRKEKIRRLDAGEGVR